MIKMINGYLILTLILVCAYSAFSKETNSMERVNQKSMIEEKDSVENARKKSKVYIEEAFEDESIVKSIVRRVLRLILRRV